jgi:hypothetical protein
MKSSKKKSYIKIFTKKKMKRIRIKSNMKKMEDEMARKRNSILKIISDYINSN